MHHRDVEFHNVAQGRCWAWAGFQVKNRWHNLIELVRFRASTPSSEDFIFLVDGEEEEARLSYADLDLQARAIGGRLQQAGARGKTVLLLYPPGLDYVAGFIGCLYAGAEAVPAYPPDVSRLNRTLPRLEAIVADAGVTCVLTTTSIASMAQLLFNQAPRFERLDWLATDNLEPGEEDNWNEPDLDGNSIAFLQYTSGSTGNPKGVMLTHSNLLHNSKLIHQSFRHSPSSRGVIWLPPYHDMGLIGGILQPIYGGFPVVLMSPIAFLQRPVRWLNAISRYHGTTSGGPNFAYSLCVRRTTLEDRAQLDLSHWDVAFNGAEPIRRQTLDEFADAFEVSGFQRKALYPCYGLAEATLIVSGGDGANGPTIRSFQARALEHNRVAPPRSLVELDVKYQVEDEQYRCITRDISSCGAFLEMDQPAPTGSVLLMEFSGTELDAAIKIRGEVARTVHKGSYKGMGVRFIFDNKEHRKQWTELVEKLSLNKPPSGAKSAQVLVSCGSVRGEQEIAIVQPDTMTRCWKDQVGEIWLQGPSIAKGYWQRPEESSGTFNACLADTGEGPYLRTGDLGFVLDDELYITGRVKDLIIIRGLNLYPQDIEFTVEKTHPRFLRPGCGAAFAVSVAGEERLVVVHEFDRRFQPDRRAVVQPSDRDQRNGGDRRAANPEIEAFAPDNSNSGEPDFRHVFDSIRQAISDAHEVQVYAIALLKPGMIPKTSSGKVQRYACRTGFLAGTLDVVAESCVSNTNGNGDEVGGEGITPPATISHAAIRDWLIALLSAHLKVPLGEFDPKAPITRHGMDSLVAVELQNEIEGNLGVVLPMVTFLRDVTVDELASQVVQQLEQEKISNEIPQSNNETERLDLASSFQESMWLLDKLNPDSSTSNLVVAATIPDQLDVEALHRAFDQLSDRHAALRTVFVHTNGRLYQSTAGQQRVPFSVVDARDWGQEALNEAIQLGGAHSFDLTKGGLLRVTIFERDEDPVFLLVAHHAIVDVWSLAILFDELRVIYESELKGSCRSASTPGTCFADFSRWQSSMLGGVEGARFWEYWQKELSGELPVLNLPTDRPRPPIQTFNGASFMLELRDVLGERVKILADDLGVTVYHVLLAGFATLLCGFCRQKDLLIGSPMACRDRASFAAAVGPFAQPVVMRLTIDGENSVEDFARHVRNKVLGAMANQQFPFPTLVDRLCPHRDPSHHPLFQAMFNYIDVPAHLGSVAALKAFSVGLKDACMKLGQLTLKSLGLQQQLIDQFDISLIMTSVDKRPVGVFHYNADLFDEKTISQLAEDYRAILSSMVESPSQSVESLSEIVQRPNLQGGHEEPSSPSSEPGYVEPSGPLEEMVAKAFGQMMGIDRVGSNDNFFALGGNSIQATQLFERLEQELQLELPLHKLFRAMTVAKIAEIIFKALEEVEGSDDVAADA